MINKFLDNFAENTNSIVLHLDKTLLINNSDILNTRKIWARYSSFNKQNDWLQLDNSSIYEKSGEI